jgi:hypothetical protein
MTTLQDMADFILEYHPPHRKWDTEIFLGWLTWHQHQGFIQRVLDFDGTMVGLTICRPIMNPRDADDHYAFDPEGNCIFVDLAIATKPSVLPALVIAALKRYGSRDWVAWKRPPFEITEFHDAHKFRRIMLRKATHHG